MYKEFYSGSTLLGFPLFALIFFVTVFVAAVLSTLGGRRKRRLEIISRLPLVDDAPSAHSSRE